MRHGRQGGRVVEWVPRPLDIRPGDPRRMLPDAGGDLVVVLEVLSGGDRLRVLFPSGGNLIVPVTLTTHA